jgi:hypothetical protein
MTPQKITYSVIALIFLVSSIAIIYYLAESDLLSYATGVFWDGILAGFAGCLFLSSLFGTISLRAMRSRLALQHGLVFSIFIMLSGLVTAILWFIKPGDSDVWWYGAITGFFSCLVLVLLIATTLIAYKLVQST